MLRRGGGGNGRGNASDFATAITTSTRLKDPTRRPRIVGVALAQPAPKGVPIAGRTRARDRGCVYGCGCG
ncbi:hypothetical protein CLIM01_06939 [Colletotrichum limetticola]|uniref:Uncharacterized protein n=1 Tax=Colletotrichum limetticola TaxID=1209924 RepID=A0ABQ9PW28_9PEZI|nr:hypothetical protein CLIM01_06939 [Colletotrichum limetticola]